MEASELPPPSRRVSPSKVERFAFRLSPDDRRLLEKAAALRRTTLTRFVLESSREVAERALAEQTGFLLSSEQYAAFCRALDEPPREIPALRELFERPEPYGS